MQSHLPFFLAGGDVVPMLRFSSCHSWNTSASASLVFLFLVLFWKEFLSGSWGSVLALLQVRLGATDVRLSPIMLNSNIKSFWLTGTVFAVVGFRIDGEPWLWCLKYLERLVLHRPHLERFNSNEWQVIVIPHRFIALAKIRSYTLYITWKTGDGFCLVKAWTAGACTKRFTRWVRCTLIVEKNSHSYA